MFLQKTVGVNVIAIKDLPEHLASSRQLHQYGEPQAVLEDMLYHYRIWVTPAPVFQAVQEFRQPFVKEVKEITVEPEQYEQQ